MGSTNIPADDATYLAWAKNFALTAQANAEELGFTTEQTAEMEALAAQFADAYAQSQRMKVLARAAVSNKDSARESCETVLRNYAKLANNSASISAVLKAKLGMKPLSAPPSPVRTPSDLSVVTSSNGVNELKWAPNGNSRTVTYIIECSSVKMSDWQIIDATSRLSYDHNVQFLGEPLFYRVSAKRSKVKSAPCTPVIASLFARKSDMHLVDAA